MARSATGAAAPTTWPASSPSPRRWPHRRRAPDRDGRIAALRDRLVDGSWLRSTAHVETVPAEAKVAGSAHVMFEGVESEALLYLLDEAGVCASAASACSSGAMDPSHVLAAMGIDRRGRRVRCA